MGNGDTSSGGYDASGKAKALSFEGIGSGVGLGMNMNQDTMSSSYHYGNKMTTFLPFYQHDQSHKHQDFSQTGGGLVCGNQMSINHHIASGIPLQHTSGSGSGPDSGKVLFTAAQWQEFERQTMIYKYIMTSIPVPSNLLSTLSIKGGVDLRFSSGSDLEPWRCRRTDGKKWRCSKDIAPDQKYCERHSHKTRSRSRKPVETQSHNTNVNTTSALNVTSSAAPTTYQNPRCTEWFMKSGTIPVSTTSNQQFQQSMNTPKVGSKRTHIFPHDFEGNNHLDTISSAAVDASVSARRQNFIDAWSRSGGGDNCSLTLSMQCSGGIDDHNDQSFELGSGDALKSHSPWLNQPSWMNSPPGGPLGEALGLGIASTVKGPLNVPTSHGYGNSTATSSSCENSGSHDYELSFIR